ncbi:MAG: hypothetical protein ABIH76_02500 [Candidatus Bathyarchaeota archaeon]
MSEIKDVNFHIPVKTKIFLNHLIESGEYKSLSEIYRIALDEFISKYTNRPSLMGLSQRQDRQQARLDRVERELRDIRKQLAENEKGN